FAFSCLLPSGKKELHSSSLVKGCGEKAEGIVCFLFQKESKQIKKEKGHFSFFAKKRSFAREKKHRG
ncbi:MAG: hypothetical protein WC472_04590, partial [Candidatus Paceibacterota bacterium]